MRSHVKHIGTRPFRGTRWVEKRHGKMVVRIEHWPDGKRSARTVGPNTPANREAADRLLANVLRRAAGLTVAEAEPLTIARLLILYLADAAGRRGKSGQPLRAATLRLYRDYHAKILAGFGPEKMAASLRRPQVREFEKRLSAQVGDGVVVQVLGHLRQVYRWAVSEAEILTTNPIADVRTTVRKPKHGPIYAQAEVEQLLAAMGDGRDWRFRTMAMLVATYGFRESQVRHLRWSDVDFDGGLITLRQDVVGSKGQPTGTVPIIPAVRPALLEAWNRRRDAAGFVLWGWRDHDKGVSNDGMNRRLHQLEQRAGVARVRGRAWHALRRAIATRIAMEMGPVQAAAWIRDTVKVTTETYVQPGRAAQDEVAKHLTKSQGAASA